MIMIMNGLIEFESSLVRDGVWKYGRLLSSSTCSSVFYALPHQGKKEKKEGKSLKERLVHIHTWYRRREVRGEGERIEA